MISNIRFMFTGRLIFTVFMIGVSLSLMAASCTGDDDDNGNEDTFAEFLVVAESAAESANLSLDDFPTGWTSSKNSEDDDEEVNLDLSEECQILDADTVPGEVTEAESDDFTGPDEQTVSSSTTVVTSAAAGKNAIDDFIDAFALQKCKDELEAGFIKLFKEDEGIDVEVSVKDVSFPNLGDSSSAYRIDISVPGFDVEMTFDLVVIQEERMLGMASFTSPINIKPDADEESDLARKFADKLKTAEATLPN